MPTPQAVGVQMPRYQKGSERVRADKIESVHDGQVLLECGARIDATLELMATGPARTGDFLVHDEGAEPTSGKLVAAADFVTNYAHIPHAYDIAAVSADEQPGARVDEPHSGSPEDPHVGDAPQVGVAPVGDVAEPEHRDEHRD